MFKIRKSIWFVQLKANKPYGPETVPDAGKGLSVTKMVQLMSQWSLKCCSEQDIILGLWVVECEKNDTYYQVPTLCQARIQNNTSMDFDSRVLNNLPNFPYLVQFDPVYVFVLILFALFYKNVTSRNVLIRLDK